MGEPTTEYRENLRFRHKNKSKRREERSSKNGRSIRLNPKRDVQDALVQVNPETEGVKI